MKTISVIPESKDHWLRLREGNINSTESSILFDSNPYKSLYEYWHEKHANIVKPFEETIRTKMGTKLQAGIAEAIAEQEGWLIKPMNQYIYSEEHRLGSSFDYEIVGQDQILEIKNVDGLIYRNSWTPEEMPLQVEFQIQHQMLLSGYRKCTVGVCVAGNDLRLYHRNYNSDVCQALLMKANEFWLMEEPPPPDYSRDFEFINGMFQTVEPGKVIESDQIIDDIVAAYQSISEQIKDLETRKNQYKAQILNSIGQAEKVKSPFYTISCSVTPEAKMEFVRKSFRNFRITPKKVKE